ncbi:MAG: hypothetical protein KGH64_00530 [Candidatus Micrarchaeota archaeon]|nr:hypothetical protein [Candidatus Micrarchaeota archaeon]MDE1859588.1 hypothetical protein [Candidatus Micrarchaeota archaeon]
MQASEAQILAGKEVPKDDIHNALAALISLNKDGERMLEIGRKFLSRDEIRLLQNLQRSSQIGESDPLSAN